MTTKFAKQAEMQMTNRLLGDFFIKNFVCPESVLKLGKGRGIVELTIEKNESISDAVMIKKLHPETDKKAIRVY